MPPLSLAENKLSARLFPVVQIPRLALTAELRLLWPLTDPTGIVAGATTDDEHLLDLVELVDSGRGEEVVPRVQHRRLVHPGIVDPVSSRNVVPKITVAVLLSLHQRKVGLQKLLHHAHEHPAKVTPDSSRLLRGIVGTEEFNEH